MVPFPSPPLHATFSGYLPPFLAMLLTSQASSASLPNQALAATFQKSLRRILEDFRLTFGRISGGLPGDFRQISVDFRPALADRLQFRQIGIPPSTDWIMLAADPVSDE